VFYISPRLRRRFERFYAIKRGYYSLWAICLLLAFSLVAELWVNNRAIFVSYNGSWYFPTYTAMIPGKTFGLDYEHETDYRELQKKMRADAKQDKATGWVLMPLVPHGPLATSSREEGYAPYPPSIKYQNYFGTDSTGRDVLARLIYGFRTAMIFSMVLMFFSYVIGIAVGCMMGFFGGWFDLIMQRVVEIWSNVPFLYVVMIVSSIIIPSFWMLLAIMVFFGWQGMTYYMRAQTYQERARLYVLSAKSLGASPFRIIIKHILPNSLSIIVTFVPFAIAGGISSLTALDYLGFGLPPPTPSWGELLDQGVSNLDAWWIATSVVVMLVLVLTMVTFVGEAVREAFDPKKFSVYE